MKTQLKKHIIKLGEKHCNLPITCDGFFYSVPVPETLKKKAEKGNK